MTLNNYFCFFIGGILRTDVELMTGPRRMGLGIGVVVAASYVEVNLFLPFLETRMTRYRDN